MLPLPSRLSKAPCGSAVMMAVLPSSVKSKPVARISLEYSVITAASSDVSCTLSGVIRSWDAPSAARSRMFQTQPLEQYAFVSGVLVNQVNTAGSSTNIAVPRFA